jgi:predicted nucleotidyltransferase
MLHVRGGTMISQYDRDSIIAISKKYGVSRVLLFGSSVSSTAESHDIDLAVEGIRPADFFSFYSELIFRLSKPVDLVDMSSTSRFHKMVAHEGVPIYG